MARQNKAVQAISAAEGFGFLAEKLKKQAIEPNVLAYKPHIKQELFHRSVAKVKLYIGGNRSGKTHGGIVEDIYRLQGKHPYREVPPAPARGRIVCVDFAQGINEIIIPKLKQLIPPSLLIGGSWDKSYNKEAKSLTCSNGSTLELMTYEQKVESFAGTSRHWIHYDEEPPLAIYNECQARLVDTDGDSFLTMTPLLGMTWIYDAIYLPGLTGENPEVEVITVDIHENPYLEQSAVARFLATLDPEERKARESGKFVSLGGLVYKKFDKNIHVIPYTDEVLKEVRHYELWTSMDHGYNAPSAWLWHGVAADGTVVTFAEHYQAEMTVKEHAEIVLAKETFLGIAEPNIRVADPATAQRQGVTGTSIQTEYAINGVYLSPGNNDVQTGVAKVQQYLEINPETNKPYWLITENCVNLIREIQRLRWQTYSSKKMQHERNAQESIHKKDDHACDSARYFFSFLPDLTPPVVPEKKTVVTGQLERYDEALAKMNTPKPNEVTTRWQAGTDNLSSLEWE